MGAATGSTAPGCAAWATAATRAPISVLLGSIISKYDAPDRLSPPLRREDEVLLMETESGTLMERDGAGSFVSCRRHLISAWGSSLPGRCRASVPLDASGAADKKDLTLAPFLSPSTFVQISVTPPMPSTLTTSRWIPTLRQTHITKSFTGLHWTQLQYYFVRNEAQARRRAMPALLDLHPISTGFDLP